MGVALVTILMMSAFLTGHLALWHTFNNNAVVMSDVMRISAQHERERSRTFIEISDVDVDSQSCMIDVDIINTGSEAITPMSRIEVIVSFSGGANESRVLRYRRNDHDPGTDTWWVKLSGQGEAEPTILRPGSTRTIQMGLDLPGSSGSSASVIIVTPNGVTARTEMSGIETPCSVGT